jgi:hypothetical protein
MNDARNLISAIEDHLGEDRKQLAAIEQQADAVADAYTDLMKRLRLEIEAAAGPREDAYRLRG